MCFCSALHLAAGLSNTSDVLGLLLSHGADVDAVNDDLCSPLFYATQANNMFAGSLLITHGNETCLVLVVTVSVLSCLFVCSEMLLNCCCLDFTLLIVAVVAAADEMFGFLVVPFFESSHGYSAVSSCFTLTEHVFLRSLKIGFPRP